MPPGSPSNAGDDDDGREGIFQRLHRAIVKPGESTYAPDAVSEMSPAEAEAANASLNDRERLIGLVAAPLAGVIAIIISSQDVNHDPANTSEYHTLLLVLLGMAVLMILASFLRKRLILGVVLALYGLGVFNLKYWGFGVPFVLAGAWYLVRAYRLTQAVKGINGETGPRRPSSGGRGPTPSKRYTPPAPRRRPAKPKPDSGD